MYRATLVLVALALLPPAARADKLVLVAGGGTKDGNCPATDAKLNTPFGVDFDKAGNMYIVEMTGQRAHKVDRTGILTTIAGTGKKGDSGDGGPATKAEFNGMHSLCVLPDGNLCLADTGGVSRRPDLWRIEMPNAIGWQRGTDRLIIINKAGDALDINDLRTTLQGGEYKEVRTGWPMRVQADSTIQRWSVPPRSAVMFVRVGA